MTVCGRWTHKPEIGMVQVPFSSAVIPFTVRIEPDRFLASYCYLKYRASIHNIKLYWVKNIL